MSVPSAEIQAEGLSKRYGRQRAVEDLTFTVEPGEICALLGPNGAGKTSTMRMLLGLAKPDAGAVRIAGAPVSLGASVLRRVGALIDGPAFVPHLTGTANLKLLWTAARQSWPPPGLADALDLAGLGAAIDRKVKSYSMGMKQRLMLVQALMRRPDVLILDEPANGLDPAEVRALRQQLAARAAAGTTVLISSHHLAEVQLLASHIVVVNRGRLVTAGPLANLLHDTGIYRVHTEEPARALAVLRDLPGVRTATIEDGDIAVTAPGLPPSGLVATLVKAGVAVTGASPAHPTLEDAYLAMTEGGDHAAL